MKSLGEYNNVRERRELVIVEVVLTIAARGGGDGRNVMLS